MAIQDFPAIHGLNKILAPSFFNPVNAISIISSFDVGSGVPRSGFWVKTFEPLNAEPVTYSRPSRSGSSGQPGRSENGIEKLVNEVAGWGEGGAWEMDVLEQTPTAYFFNVTRCSYYEKYRELGLEEFGVGFSCCRDEPFARGFNPKLRLLRTKTIMEGADHCDFRYYLRVSGQ
ncbi:MAG: L-2-amino-thiazoline-4-carboxylic acid hydrolase [Thermodesulfobacteriota bacterium]|nr:L-2-amino-thiazoline-4-carboxylic acid hydrolase [Thermodesulfobacteriota bacterium]